MKRLAVILTIITSLFLGASAEETPKRKAFTYPPSMDGAQVETYKEINGTTLKLWIFQPAEKAADKPAGGQ